MHAPIPYLDDSARPDRISGGARLIPIQTPRGEFRVWTKRHGNNPDIKLLLLHGGPGGTHEPARRSRPMGARPVPAFMADMARRLPNGRYLHCPEGSHCAMFDDQETYFDGLIDFLLDVGGRG